MALHRDIYWIGRQWAVTGFGIQAIDQRLRGVFDIAVTRLWDEDLVQSRRTKPGLNVEDFDKALAVARTRYPQAVNLTSARPEPAPASTADAGAHGAAVLPAPAAVAAEAPVEGLALQLRIEGRLARFTPLWRVSRPAGPVSLPPKR